MTRSGWLPVMLGLLLGLAAGLYYSWLLNPVEYVDTAPASLRQDFKADYLALIAASYVSSGDLGRARARLALFADPDPASGLAALAQQRMAAGGPASEAAALARLAADLKGSTAATATPETAASPSATRTPPPTVTPRPSFTPTATPGAPFLLVHRERICSPLLVEPLIQLEVVDAAGQPVPGVEAIVVWDAGQDGFFTGLKPELGLGYADFAMSEGVSYTLQLAEGVEPITGLIAHECEQEAGSTYLGGWLLRFRQPAND